MAVRDGMVVWLGDDAVGQGQFPDAEIVDLDGAFVAPAFVDCHVHLTATGLQLTGLDLATATSRDHCLKLIADHVAAKPGEPVWGHGWDDTAWAAGQALTTADIDAVIGRRPAYLSRIDVHSAIASTALRDMVAGLPTVAGFDPQLPLSAQAHHLVRAEARRLLTVGQRADACRAALDAAAAVGIVAVHECAGPEIGGAEDFSELRAQDHGVEVVGYWGEAVSSASQARALIELSLIHISEPTRPY